MSYYYQIGRHIDNQDKASDQSEWRTADFSRITKNDCVNVDQVDFNKPGTKAMDKDDNEAMFIPRGYAVLGYDHDNCENTGRGVQYYHGNHRSRSESNSNGNKDAVRRVKAITGNRPGGIYNYKGGSGGDNEDTPRNLASKMSSWRVFDVRTDSGLTAAIANINEVKSEADGNVTSRKSTYLKDLCKGVDKNTFDKDMAMDEPSRRESFVTLCDSILSKSELKRVWPEPSESSPVSDPIDDEMGGWSDSDSDSDSDPDSDSDSDDGEGTNWLLYGSSFASSVSLVIIVVIVAVILMKKKKKMSINV